MTTLTVSLKVFFDGDLRCPETPSLWVSLRRFSSADMSLSSNLSLKRVSTIRLSCPSG